MTRKFKYWWRAIRRDAEIERRDDCIRDLLWELELRVERSGRPNLGSSIWTKEAFEPTPFSSTELTAAFNSMKARW
jgi:hypothetical protein